MTAKLRATIAVGASLLNLTMIATAVDAAPRPYRHCHVVHTRVYCHKDERLPVNWPPLSNTPILDTAQRHAPPGHSHNLPGIIDRTEGV